MLRDFTTRRIYRYGIGCCTALALCFTASGCAQRADGSTVTAIDDIQVMRMSSAGLTPAAARQLDRAQRYAEMRLTGAATGAIVGALAGALAIRGNRAAGAAGGAALGAALGYLGGAYVANLNSQAEDRRTSLNVQLAAANAAVREAEEAVIDARAIVSDQRAALRNTVSAYRAGTIAKAEAEARVGRAKEHLVLIDEAVRSVQDNISGISATIEDNQQNNRSSRGLNSRVQQLRAEEQQLLRQRQRMVAAFQGVPPELGTLSTS
ncbi:MAG: hypothetical protein AAF674_12940 [Pseudomonadota bacterium]